MLLLTEKEIASIYQMSDALQDVAHILRAKVEGGVENPLRTVIEYPAHEASVLYMPSADLKKERMAMKAVTIFPQNPSRNLPTTQGILLISDAKNGQHLAIMNASYLTRLRTGALSALATDRLARSDASILTAIGTGGMAFEQVLGMLAVRPIQQIYLVNRTIEKAYQFKQRLRQFGVDESIEVIVEEHVSKAVQAAHIICCSTRSETPVFNGLDVQPGTHVNGVGSYLPHMREVDVDFILRADKIVVDDWQGATEEAGELIYAKTQHEWSFDNIYGQLKEVVTSHKKGRTTNDEITFFKSVGAAYFDLAVAQGVYEKAVQLNVGSHVEL